MNLRRRHKIGAEVNTSSLNDIMFFLLLFFLLASTLVAPHVIKVTLPKASTGQSVPKKNVSVSVNREGQYFIEKTLVTEQQLNEELKSYQGKAEEVTVIINADSAAMVQPFVNVMDIASRYKLKLVVAAQKK
ncbi:ExbD/TolR family protein [Solitalea koreensis]|uniref:Biopolymer transport protein ExbD n=1 Tax=Solitalea koreensis TaxID=543615 RepID=A0A521D1T5_9SPHI|nr:biopolymer transporter ExbD [Solitalea koreensis]SMO65622.1 biopolymer transport protein ExbD [Solitalea koreensis]